jgi:hypothetical protein
MFYSHNAEADEPSRRRPVFSQGGFLQGVAVTEHLEADLRKKRGHIGPAPIWTIFPGPVRAGTAAASLPPSGDQIVVIAADETAIGDRRGDIQLGLQILRLIPVVRDGSWRFKPAGPRGTQGPR